MSNLKLFPDPLQPSRWSSEAIPIPMGIPNIGVWVDGVVGYFIWLGVWGDWGGWGIWAGWGG